MDDILATRARLNQASADFLKVDVVTALTFSKIALESHDSVKRRRNCENARRGYDTIVRLADKVTLTSNEAQFLAEKLQELRSDLLRLGEVFGTA